MIYRLSINNDLLIESCNFGSLSIATQKGLAYLKSATMKDETNSFRALIYSTNISIVFKISLKFQKEGDP